MTKKVTFLTRHDGEVCYTAHSLSKVFDPTTDAAKLTETKSALASSDDFRLVTVPAYGTLELDLPDWMDPDEYAGSIHFQVSYKWFLGLGGNPVWGATWFHKLSSLEVPLRFACMKLLNTKKFRSAFRASLRDQLVTWLDGKSTFDRPFSPRQVDCLLDRYTMMEANRLDSSLYRARAA